MAKLTFAHDPDRLYTANHREATVSFSRCISNQLEDILYIFSPVRGCERGSCFMHVPIGCDFRWSSKCHQTHNTIHTAINSLIRSLIRLQPARFFLSAILLNGVKCFTSMTIFVLTEGKALVSFFPFPLCSHYVISLVDAWLPSWLIGWLAALQSNCDCVTGRRTGWMID